jgi:hypothetical protein
MVLTLQSLRGKCGKWSVMDVLVEWRRLDLTGIILSTSYFYRDVIDQFGDKEDCLQYVPHLNVNFDGLLSSFKASMVNTAKRRCASTNAQSFSRLGALLNYQFQQKFLRSLVPSSSTLIVIPNVLLEHWQVSSDICWYQPEQFYPLHTVVLTHWFSYLYDCNRSR